MPNSRAVAVIAYAVVFWVQAAAGVFAAFVFVESIFAVVAMLAVN